MQKLLSLPSNFVEGFEKFEGKSPPEWIAACDPPGSKLGSGGGTAHSLAGAWEKTGSGFSFGDWLRESRKLIIHGGGQSRRLPAYAPVGKIEIPIPVFRWATGQRLNQSLLDFQVPFYRDVFRHAPEGSRVMVTCGDVLLRRDQKKLHIPEADIVCFGLWEAPEEAQHHGVFFCPKNAPDNLAFFLHKPTVDQLRKFVGDYLFLIDIGVWLLSERAVKVLMQKCGWDWEKQCFPEGIPGSYELYADFGLGLGSRPSHSDDDLTGLSSVVIPLPGGEFYHFGTSRKIIESSTRLQNVVLDQRLMGTSLLKPHPDIFVQNAQTEIVFTNENHTIWIENAFIPNKWRLTHDHVLTGIPENEWDLPLPPGICLDMVPLKNDTFAVRAYGIDDPFKGAIGEKATFWLGRPAVSWFELRNISFQEAGVDPEDDIHDAPIFPVLNFAEIGEQFIQWLFYCQQSTGEKSKSKKHQTFRRQWLSADRLSARQLSDRVNLDVIFNQKRQYLHRILRPLAENWKRSVFYSLDLAATAEAYAASHHPLPKDLSEKNEGDVILRVHDKMFRAAVSRHRSESDWQDHEREAFDLLRTAVVDQIRTRPVHPVQSILEDQIIWGRTPARLDLAGGWTDTPPHCFIFGGKVVNLAVEINGQPPIQVFTKTSTKFEIVLRSIDLGVEERIRTYEELSATGKAGGSFSIAKVALAFAGFLPEFHDTGGYASLKEQLQKFGGGFELSLLAALPKGSGLGTSSILASTVLGTLSELCHLNWDVNDLCQRTLGIEQMLTTGGGWQDQLGGILKGLKLIETFPGLIQIPVIRWLPPHLFRDPESKQKMLLYYTGITRIAKSILQDIVRGMFLNSKKHLDILYELAAHAEATYDALLKNDWDGLCQCIARSWELNQSLDEGTNSPEIQIGILDPIKDYVAAAKLLGAGGGGYMLIFAKDVEAALRIKQILEETPPNSKARFVDFSLSDTGLQITRS